LNQAIRLDTFTNSSFQNEFEIGHNRLSPVAEQSRAAVAVAKDRVMVSAMIRQIAPQFFTTDMQATLDYYKDKLGFDCLSTWQDPPVYAIVARDEHRIHFRLADPPTPNPDKYPDELLDAYLFIEDADALYAEYVARGVEFTRALGDTPWHSREFVVKDCDGRLLAFGAVSD
jgi:uncharacterized glyoxalase superfamily protein PhnB